MNLNALHNKMAGLYHRPGIAEGGSPQCSLLEKET